MYVETPEKRFIGWFLISLSNFPHYPPMHPNQKYLPYIYLILRWVNMYGRPHFALCMPVRLACRRPHHMLVVPSSSNNSSARSVQMESQGWAYRPRDACAAVMEQRCGSYAAADVRPMRSKDVAVVQLPEAVDTSQQLLPYAGCIDGLMLSVTCMFCTGNGVGC